MNSQDFAKNLHSIKCKQIASGFVEKESSLTDFSKATVEQALDRTLNQRQINSKVIAEKFGEDSVSQLSKAVEMGEEAFEKAVKDQGLEVFDIFALNKFKSNLVKAASLGKCSVDDIEKAKKDLGKLTKVQVTDKNGQKRTVWVKRGGEDEASQGKPKSSYESETKTKEEGEHIISRAKAALDNPRTPMSMRAKAQEMIDHETKKWSKEIEAHANYSHKDHPHNDAYEQGKKAGESGEATHSYDKNSEHGKAKAEAWEAGHKSVAAKKKEKPEYDKELEDMYDKKVKQANDEAKKIMAGEGKYSKMNMTERDEAATSVQRKANTKDYSNSKEKQKNSPGLAGLSNRERAEKGLPLKPKKEELNSSNDKKSEYKEGEMVSVDVAGGTKWYGAYHSKHDIEGYHHIKVGGTLISAHEKNIKSKEKQPSAKEESKEHSGTYKKLKEDAKDGKLDMSKKELGKNIEADHKKEGKEEGKKPLSEGDRVKASSSYGGKSGTVSEVKGSFVTVKHKDGTSSSYHESDLKPIGQIQKETKQEKPKEDRSAHLMEAGLSESEAKTYLDKQKKGEDLPIQVKKLLEGSISASEFKKEKAVSSRQNNDEYHEKHYGKQPSSEESEKQAAIRRAMSTFAPGQIKSKPITSEKDIKEYDRQEKRNPMPLPKQDKAKEAAMHRSMADTHDRMAKTEKDEASKKFHTDKAAEYRKKADEMEGKKEESKSKHKVGDSVTFQGVKWKVDGYLPSGRVSLVSEKGNKQTSVSPDYLEEKTGESTSNTLKSHLSDSKGWSRNKDYDMDSKHVGGDIHAMKDENGEVSYHSNIGKENEKEHTEAEAIEAHSKEREKAKDIVSKYNKDGSEKPKKFERYKKDKFKTKRGDTSLY